MFYLLTESFSYLLIDLFNIYGAPTMYQALSQPGGTQRQREKPNSRVKVGERLKNTEGSKGCAKSDANKRVWCI